MKEANGEIDTQHPGYLGSQDTYYVGYFKGVESEVKIQHQKML